MKRFYIASIKDVTIATVLLFSSWSSTCFAQEKLSNSLNETTKLVKPGIYSQPVSNIRTPITDGVKISADSPHFIQKFSQDNSALLSQTKAQVLEPGTSDNLILQGSLPVEKSGLKSGSSLQAISCDDDTPIGTDDLYVTGNDKTLAIAAPGFLANDIDLQGEALTATLIVDNVDNGSMSAFLDGSFSYTPNPGFVGTDQFQYKMRDASLNGSAPVTVTIEVLVGGNRTPIGKNDSYGALANRILSVPAPGFLANDIDQDGDVITANLIVDNVDHGTMSAFPDGSFSYTPTPGFIGTDQFQYKMRDSELNGSEPITVTIQVFEGNRSPVGTDDLFGVVMNTSHTIPAPGFLINDIDPDGDVLTATLISDNVDHGTLNAFPDGSFTYTPTPGFTGTDQFQYKMRDSELNGSEAITVTLEVIGSGVLPIGFADSYKTADGSVLSIAAPGFLFNDIDQNGENLTATVIVDYPDNGTVNALTDGSFIYTPTPGFVGIDQFQYKMQDASLNVSAPITVTIEVAASYNRNPLGLVDEYAALSNTTLTIAAPGFLANDIDQDGDVLTATVITDGVDHGTLSAFADGSFNYTPETGFTGTDQFQYKMKDALSNQSEAITVTIEVYEGNRNPSGTDDAYAVVKNTTLNIAAAGFLVNDYDPDGDLLTATVITDGVDHGTLSAFADGSFNYTPEPGFTGTDQFQYKMQDAMSNQSEPVTVILEVVGPNEPPVASSNNITAECTGPSGTSVTLDGSNSIDPEGGALIYTWYENSSIIAGPSELPTAEVTLPTGIHTITLMVEDECGNTSNYDASVIIEDTSAPLVEAAFLPANHPREFEISCSSGDVCSTVISSVSVILIPDLVSPTVTLKNNKNFSLDIDLKKNTVSVKAPNAAAFWASIMSNAGVRVGDGQIISAKSDKNKYNFNFDASGNLISVDGDVVTLRCTATDGNGNTGVSEATIPSNKLKSVEIADSGFIGEDFNGLHRNYPNPFTSETTIEYRMQKSAFVNITVYDQAGRMVKELASQQMQEGLHQIVWDAKQNKTGIYYYRIKYDGNLFSDKMILLQH